MSTLTLTAKTLATLALLACYATTIEWRWDSTSAPPAAATPEVAPVYRRTSRTGSTVA